MSILLQMVIVTDIVIIFPVLNYKAKIGGLKTVSIFYYYYVSQYPAIITLYAVTE